ncbi:hypothetical protein SAMN02745121_01299 [Nannocystis exedens]|uniref:Uncharacterized protein n=1 Tax=Nannocystis exedens TaxID=54 RepID=A0A1I1UTR1_9BACT|nr:hypothetical protein [Nannocystis exedens]PCC72090.1 hypothetical protein NAEX_05169 [Nannocystis exedens]SFD74191.1 hypothetical protein SAMN02745121_01299 [Nannocystis exedens]
MSPLSDEELERQIAAAIEAEEPAALLAIDRAHALTLPQLERLGQALVDLNDELGIDDDDPGPLLVRAAILRHGRAVPWTFTRGRASYTLNGEQPWSILDAIAFGEAWDEGLELTAPATARLPWPKELAARLALDYTADLLRDLCGACDDDTRNLLLARLADFRGALAGDDVERQRQIAQEVRELAKRAERIAERCADAAEAADTDPALNERAYAWEGARLACLAVQSCIAGPHEALGELFELRRQAIYPIHAAEHDRDRWYSRAMAEYDQLLYGDELVPHALARIGQLLRAALDDYIAALPLAPA